MEYVFPLKQHVGVPCEPVVMTGEEVKRGQLIAEKPENAPVSYTHLTLPTNSLV